MIATRILDCDMGEVARLPLTGRGTIHGITVVIDGVILPEIDMGLVEMCEEDRGVKRFTEHARQLNNPELERKFVDVYSKFAGAKKK